MITRFLGRSIFSTHSRVWGKENHEAGDDDDHPGDPNPFLMFTKASKHNVSIL
jgi:hypothetical protein